MSVFFTADNHFDHPNILKHCKRPWLKETDLDESGNWVSEQIRQERVSEMNQVLITNHNRLVSKKDTVYYVGDFAWKDHRHFMNELNGTKILLIGSHDKMPQLSLDQFTRVIGSKHQPGVLEIEIDKQPVTLSHYPMSSWGASFHGSWHFYGHTHGRKPEYDNVLACDVGVDVWGYYPVPWEVLKLKMASRKCKWSDSRRDYSDGDVNMRVKVLKEANLKFLAERGIIGGIHDQERSN